MRLWSVHPKYLDNKGLGAVWREGIQGIYALQGTIQMHRYHPQLFRFKKTRQPLTYLRAYLYAVWQESQQRQLKYDVSKIGLEESPAWPEVLPLNVTRGQLDYERHLLYNKLGTRKKIDQDKVIQLAKTPHIMTHPLFIVVSGDVEFWEKRKVK